MKRLFMIIFGIILVTLIAAIIIVTSKEPASMQKKSTQDLMAICEAQWTYHTDPNAVRRSEAENSRHYRAYVKALNELNERGPEILDWCRAHLQHADYDAREQAAFFLGQLGRRRQLGDKEALVIAELGELIRRPIEEDNKEMQAVDAAIDALGEIGNPAGIVHVRVVLEVADLKDDAQWTAARALGQLTGQNFMDAEDPVKAAQAWCKTHP
jgi:hypothetical protein